MQQRYLTRHIGCLMAAPQGHVLWHGCCPSAIPTPTLTQTHTDPLRGLADPWLPLHNRCVLQGGAAILAALWKSLAFVWDLISVIHRTSPGSRSWHWWCQVLPPPSISLTRSIPIPPSYHVSFLIFPSFTPSLFVVALKEALTEAKLVGVHTLYLMWMCLMAAPGSNYINSVECVAAHPSFLSVSDCNVSTKAAKLKRVIHNGIIVS